MPGRPRRGPHAADPARAPAQDDPRDATHRAFLGVGFGPVPGPIAYHLGIGEEVGVLVGDVWKDSPAEKAALRTNDVIVSVDGKEVRGPDSFVEALANRKPGDKIALGLMQKGTRKDLELTLAERPREIPGLGFDPRTPGSPWGRTFVPEQGQRGRVIVRRPDGTDQSFDFPGGSFDMDGFFEKLEAEFPDIDGHVDMAERMKGLLESLRSQGGAQAWSSRNSVVRMVEDGFDVTVTESGGSRTATVKQGEKTIAENLPQDQWKTLPEDVLRRVEKAAKSIDPLSSPPVKIERKSSEEEKADDSLKA